MIKNPFSAYLHVIRFLLLKISTFRYNVIELEMFDRKKTKQLHSYYMHVISPFETNFSKKGRFVLPVIDLSQFSCTVQALDLCVEQVLFHSNLILNLRNSKLPMALWSLEAEMVSEKFCFSACLFAFLKRIQLFKCKKNSHVLLTLQRKEY